jgi:hypothetical protein
MFNLFGPARIGTGKRRLIFAAVTKSRSGKGHSLSFADYRERTVANGQEFRGAESGD